MHKYSITIKDLERDAVCFTEETHNNSLGSTFEYAGYALRGCWQAYSIRFALIEIKDSRSKAHKILAEIDYDGELVQSAGAPSGYLIGLSMGYYKDLTKLPTEERLTLRWPRKEI